MIWAFPDLLDSKDIEIFPKSFADHNPVLWPLNAKRKTSHSWCMYMHFWRDETFCKQVALDIKTFFSIIRIMALHYTQFGMQLKPCFEGL